MAVLSKGLEDLFAQYYTDNLIDDLIQKNKFKDFQDLFDKLDTLSKNYDSLLTKLEAEKKGSPAKFVERLFGKVYKGKYDKDTKSYKIRKKSGFLELGSENSAKNLAKSLINSDANDLLEKKINEVYKELMDVFLKSLDTLMDFTQEIRGTESFDYLIAGITQNKASGLDELKYLATLQPDQMHILFQQINAFAIQHDPRTGELVFKLNEGITSNQLLQLIGTNGDVLQGQALQQSQNKQIFDLLQGKVKAENGTFIGSDRLIELIRNPTFVDQLINIGANGELSIKEQGIEAFRFHEDTVSMLAGSDIMLGGRETSVKTLRSTIGFQITSVDQILNALYTLSSQQNMMLAINKGFHGENLPQSLMEKNSQFNSQMNTMVEQAQDQLINEVGNNGILEMNMTLPIY